MTTWPIGGRCARTCLAGPDGRPARELRTFGVTDGLLARHALLGDEINRKALRAAHTAALWEAAGWILYAAGFGAAIMILVLRAARPHASTSAVVEVVSLLRRAPL